MALGAEPAGAETTLSLSFGSDDAEEETLSLEGLEQFDGDDGAASGAGISLEAHGSDPFAATEEPKKRKKTTQSKTQQAARKRHRADVKAARARLEEVLAKGNLEDAILHISDVLDLEPDDAELLIQRGRVYLDLGDYTHAMSDLVRAEGLLPDSPEPHVGIGDLFFARKEYRKAIRAYDAAIELNSGHVMAWCRRGLSAYYRRDYTGAVENLERAKSLDPEFANIDTLLSMVRKKIR